MAYFTKKTYADKLKDPRWQKKKNSIVERDDYTCQFCHVTYKPLQVHHFYYNKNGNPWDVADDALVTVCEDCHFIDHCDDFTELEKELIEFVRMFEYRVPKMNELVNKLVLKYRKNPYSTNG